MRNPIHRQSLDAALGLGYRWIYGMCDRQGKLALLPHRRRASVGDIVPTMELWNRGATNRAATLAYDLLLLLVAFWFALSSVPSVPWTVFLRRT